MSQSNISSGRVPPHNIDAEKSLLGAMIISDKAALIGIESIRENDFYLGAHSRIFMSMLKLSSVGKPIDLITLSDRLDADGALEAVGGPSYIAELSQFVPTASNVNQYINIVKSDSTLRKLIIAAGEISDECFNDTHELSQILASAEKKIFDISQQESKRSFIPMEVSLNDTLLKLQERFNNRSSVTGLKSGFTILDTCLTGLHPGQLILIAARPSMGKTALMLDIAQQTARFNENAKIAIFSLEMPYDHLVERMLSGIGGVELQKIRTGKFNEQGWDKIYNAADTLHECEIYIDDTSGTTVMEMLSKCRRLKIEHGLSLVVIDYLQLMSSAGTGRRESRQQEVSEITRALKLMARELDVPVILGSQLSRAPEQRSDHRPMLSDLRESGAIEQDADVVMFIYREDYYKIKEGNADELTNKAEIIVAKQRNGPTRMLELHWDAEHATFRDISTDYN